MVDTPQRLYFDRIANEFNEHYDAQKPWLTRTCDRVFRQGMVERFRYLTERLDWRGQSVLDVGCGPGQYMAAFVEKGAAEVVGIDFAPGMVDLATENFKRWGVDGKSRVLLGDFLSTDFDRLFDSVVAIGYFDYIIGARALDGHFGAMLALAQKRVVASFPYRWSFKTAPRLLWLSLRGCPVRFYSVAEVKALMHRMNVTRFHIERMSGTVLVTAEKS